MNIIVTLGGIGCTSVKSTSGRMCESKVRNIGTMVNIAKERVCYVKTMTIQELFDMTECVYELDVDFTDFEDDETKMRRIENEFFTDIQKLYGYHACMLKHQLAGHETRKIFKPVKIIQTNFVKQEVVCNQIQSPEYPVPVKNESRFRFIRKKESCSKEEVRLKPPLRCILELLFQTLERTLKSLEEIMQKQWKEWQYPQNRVRTNWMEPYQECRRKYQRYENNKIHPEMFQYRRFCFVIT